jgi:sugar lactone lactonase YvrE
MRFLLTAALLLAGCAGGGGSAPAPVLALVAGDLRATGYADGSGPEAGFHNPFGIAIDSAGNVYVTDGNNHTIRKMTPSGVVTTLAGRPGIRGYADGAGYAACFDSPLGIAADRAGNLYVADYGSYTIRKITPAGVVTTFAGTAGAQGNTDGPRETARFSAPLGVAIDSSGNIYVTDGSGGKPGMGDVIRKVTPGGVVTTFAGTAGAAGSIDGTGAAARFKFPYTIGIDGADNLYVVDAGSSIIRKITPAGVVTTLAGTADVEGSADGTGPAARFDVPQGIAADSAGNVYVADYFNHAIRKITPAGTVSTLVGVMGQPSFVPGALPGRIRSPRAVAISGTTLYVTLPHGVAVVWNRP